MSTPDLPEAWIDEALDAATPATELEVSRVVWGRHENELRAAGDLLLTWQVQLRDAVATRLAAGTLRRDGDLLASTPATGPGEHVDPRSPWTPDQVVPAVEAYVDLLRAEHSGRPMRRVAALQTAVASTGRPPEQVERIWSNVSHVLQEHGVEPLLSCPPRSNVPAGVRPAVRGLLGLEA